MTVQILHLWRPQILQSLWLAVLLSLCFIPCYKHSFFSRHVYHYPRHSMFISHVNIMVTTFLLDTSFSSMQIFNNRSVKVVARKSKICRSFSFMLICCKIIALYMHSIELHNLIRCILLNIKRIEKHINWIVLVTSLLYTYNKITLFHHKYFFEKIDAVELTFGRNGSKLNSPGNVLWTFSM